MMNANAPHRLQLRFTFAALVVAPLAASCGRADFGGVRRYIKAYCESAGKPPTRVCMQLLKRTCDAVSLVLEEAKRLRSGAAAA